jgi:hypothetical protein
MNIEYKTLTGCESYGSEGTIGIKVLVGGDLPKDMEADEIWRLGHYFVENLRNELYAQKIKEDPESAIYSKQQRDELLSCFPEHIFVEEIENGYSEDAYYSRHLPWFIVTTKLGRIKIGWRKRVIEIDWTDSIIKHTAEELFPDENVTKGDKYIHAWSLEKAKEYIEALGIKN